MSNSFSVTQFSQALGALCAKTDERATAISEWLAGSLEGAAKSWLIEGSDALRQCLAKLETSGKSTVAVKLRKVVRAVQFEFRGDNVVYGNVAAFSVIPSKNLLGGNSPRCNDHAVREASCEAYGELVKGIANVLLAPPVREVNPDTLSGIGNFNEKTIGEKLAKADQEHLIAAASRLTKLAELVAGEIASRESAEAQQQGEKTEAEKAADAAAAAAAAEEAEKASHMAEKLTRRSKRPTRVSQISEALAA